MQEVNLYTRQCANLEFTCLCLLSSGTKGVRHFTSHCSISLYHCVLSLEDFFPQFNCCRIFITLQTQDLVIYLFFFFFFFLVFRERGFSV
ncbi:mCG147157 [Mus musculus]|nr:mCG147157 [Mus musculus]